LVNVVVAYYHIHHHQKVDHQKMYLMEFEHDNQNHQLDQLLDLNKEIKDFCINQISVVVFFLPSRQHCIKKSLGFPAKFGQFTLLNRSNTSS
jgi:hypothetical protein